MPETRPTSYTIRLAPDLKKLTFSGSVAIDIVTDKPGEPIVLDSIGLEITSCTVRSDGEEVKSSLSAGDTTVSVLAPAASAGNVTVCLEFNGKLGRSLFGFYDAPYEQDGQVKHLAVTQFESEAARRAFPCFDHPKHNAPFSIALEAPAGTIAISNSPVDTIEQIDGGALYRFQTTPPMPTYLLFFGVGDFECREEKGFKVPIRAATVPGKAVYADKAIEMAKAAVAYCEEFTGIEYPIGKLDLIGIPAFAFGAMENLGAITFRENLLLYVPGTTSERGFERNCLITAHEVAHMWFGDLVSPSEWRFLWLNEAFATYLQYLIGQAVFPGRHIGERFLLEGFGAACRRDSLVHTFPIELPEGCYLDVDASTAPIFYQKAGLVLRMVHCRLGAEKFREGVRSYLAQFAFQSTDTLGFLHSFSKGAGLEAAGMIENWIRQPGFPLVRAARRGDTLHLEQERFTWLAEPSDQLWHIPVSLLLFDDNGVRDQITLLLEKRNATIELPEGITAYKINAGQIGLFHTACDDENLVRLGALARDGKLTPEDRYGLAFDLSALLLRGEITVEKLSAFLLEYYMHEREFLPLACIARALNQLWRIVPGGRELIADTGRRIFEPVIAGIGVVPSHGEDYLEVLLRSELLWPLVLFRSKGVYEELLRQFESFAAGEQVEADLLQTSLFAGAHSGKAGFGLFRKIIEDAQKADELKFYLYGAMGWFQDEHTLSQVLSYTEESIAEQNRIHVYRNIAANPVAGKLLFSWLVENLPNLESVHHYTRSVALAEFIPVCEPEDEADLDKLLDGCDFGDHLLNQVISMAKETRKVFRSLEERR